MKVITILFIMLHGSGYETEYPSTDECGQALLKLAVSDLNHDGRVYARCIPTGAPTVSLRPVARP